MMVRVGRAEGLTASIPPVADSPGVCRKARERVGVNEVNTGCLCTPSQLESQVATLSQEVTQLQRQQEQNLKKESPWAKVVRSTPCQVAHPSA